MNVRTATSVRDYTKPIMLRLEGKKGLRTYLEIVTSPPTRYDAEAEAKKAAENLRKQGINV